MNAMKASKTPEEIEKIKAEIRQCTKRIQANIQFVRDNAHQTSRNLQQSKRDCYSDSDCVSFRRFNLLKKIGLTMEQFLAEEASGNTISD